MTDRKESIKSMQKLCKLLEKNEDIQLPRCFKEITFYFFDGGDQLDPMAKTRRAIGGKWEKTPYADYFRLSGAIGSIDVELTTYRKAVCTRVVTGTRTDTRRVPDPTVLDERPLVEITEVIENVEWVCPDSLLNA